MTVQNKLKVATERLTAFTDKLARIADWKEELAARLDGAAERFHGALGIDLAELDAITDEVHAFISACHALADTIKPKLKEAA